MQVPRQQPEVVTRALRSVLPPDVVARIARVCDSISLAGACPAPRSHGRAQVYGAGGGYARQEGVLAL